MLARRYGEQLAWTPYDFMYAHGAAHCAILYAPLLAPRFVEIEGSVFLSDVLPVGSDREEFEHSIRAYRSNSPARLKSFVDSYNWFELPYQFTDRSSTNEEYDALAELLVDAWGARLASLYPGRRFHVRVMDATETGSEIGVGFEEVFPDQGQ